MIEQRTPEWYEARKGRITASAVGAILGLSPYQTRQQVMERMIAEYRGEDVPFTGNVATDYGTFNEANAISDYELLTGNSVEKCGFYQYMNWAGASPDGIVSRDDAPFFGRGLLEIKCPYGLRKDEAPEFKKINEGELPHYYAQVQFQMMCSGYLWCDFFQWSPRGYQLERVECDEKWIRENEPVLLDFWNEYINLRDKDIDEVKALRLTTEYKELVESIERATERKKELLDEIVAFNNNQPGKIADMRLSKVEKEGAISYSKVVKEHLPDLDLSKYRGKPTEYWVLK